jgi:RHH-type proline utilization regulon transcriptional repressor/proline dehydrogenase/delta 1-pyrroline-5-carboxylate dehydrogenase
MVKTEELSRHLIEKINQYDQSFFEKLTDTGLDLTANFKLIRIHLLKFLAILPSLNHEQDGQEVKRIFLESLRRLNADSKKAKAKRLKGQDSGLPKRYLVVIKFIYNICGVIPAKLLSSTIKFAVSFMAKRFIAGESIEKAEKSLSSLLNSKRDATLDQLGELVVSKEEADLYETKVLEIINGMNQHIKPGSRNAAGINKAHVSIKVSALTHDFKPYDFDSTYESIAPRLKNILLTAKKNEVFINIDAEHYHYRDMVLEVYGKILTETEELKNFADTGIVIQAYLRDGHLHFQDVLALAKKRGLRMPVRLVKGAYWDVETVEATAFNFEAPQFLNKEETDIHFRQIVYLCLKEDKFIQLAVGSHNILDHCFSEALRECNFPNAPVIEHQCLHMTYEALSYGLSLMNWPTRNYIPVGNLIVGMAYLVRRIMENSSQVGILTIMRSHKKKMNFQTPTERIEDKFLKKEIVYDDSILKLRRNFKNVYPIRTYRPKQLEYFFECFNERKLMEVDADIKGERVYSPSHPEMVLGSVELDTTTTVDEKIKTLKDSAVRKNWADVKNERHASLLKLAELLLLNRESFTSLIIFEAGKTMEEAIADVDEAIDFILFYVRDYFDIKINHGEYSPRGVIGVIAPWNFPLAIPVGMSVAALTTGNTVLLKPAEQTPLIVKKFYDLAIEAGISSDVFKLAFGHGDIGAHITNHPDVDGVVFTGSKAVGTQIYKSIKSSPKEGVSRMAITEMGGKNAVIVTNNCELDETVSGLIYACFAHAGQKCSAASRIIIDSKVKDAFILRFVEAVKDIKVGRSDDFSTFINPLVSKEDKERLIDLNKQAKAEVESFGGKIHIDLSGGDYPGHCVGPSVYEVSALRAMDKTSIAQTEIFGPLIHIIPFEDLDEAIKIFNSTEYALTGGIYCQSQDDIDYLSPRLESGNIYINRPNTGARVAIEPFGGFKMSGTGPKAGSIDYLYSFMTVDCDKNIDNLLIDSEVSEEHTRANTSKLSQIKRTDYLIELIDRLVNRYEFFFKEIDYHQKDDLLSLMNYLRDETNLLENREFPNRDIPGQISFDRRDYKLGRGLFVATNPELNFDLLMDILVNIAIGNAVNLICLNTKCHEVWKPIIELVYKVGFSPFNIIDYNFDEKLAIEALQDKSIQFVVSENTADLVDFISNNLFDIDRAFLVKYVISGSTIFMRDWDRYFKEYSIARSFAINTMRHGAPLELNL